MHKPINEKILGAAFNYALYYLNEKEEGNFLFNVFEIKGEIKIKVFPKPPESGEIKLFLDPAEKNWTSAAIVFSSAPNKVVTSIDFDFYDKKNPKALFLRKGLRNDDSSGVNKIVFKDDDFFVESPNPYYIKKPWWKFI